MALSKSGSLALVVLLSSVITHLLGIVQVVDAGSSTSATSTGESVSSSQPLWSYQVKPGMQVGGSSSNYLSNPLGGPHPYPSGPSLPSIFDAFNGALSQRQGALTSSPFLSILPIILIAAGGLLLLLPLLTMMMASPFGGFGAGFGNNFGYPQAGLNKKRSLGDQLSRSSFYDILEHVSSTIDDLSKKYSQTGTSRRAKSNTTPVAGQQPGAEQQAANQKLGATQVAPSSSQTNEESVSSSNGSASSLNLISSLRT